MIQRRRDGQEEDEGQEGDPDCECQAQDREGREEAAPAGVADIPRKARAAGSHRPPPQLVAVPLLEPLIRTARAWRPRDGSEQTANSRVTTRNARPLSILRVRGCTPTLTDALLGAARGASSGDRSSVGNAWDAFRAFVSPFSRTLPS